MDVEDVPLRFRSVFISDVHLGTPGCQADLLLDHFGTVRPTDRLLDAGSGRGGTSFMANLRFGCEVDGAVELDWAQSKRRNPGLEGRCTDHEARHGFTVFSETVQNIDRGGLGARH